MLKESQIEQLNALIKDGYGPPERMAHRLSEVIFMLHYLEEEVFTQREVQSSVDLLQALGEVLRR